MSQTSEKALETYVEEGLLRITTALTGMIYLRGAIQ